MSDTRGEAELVHQLRNHEPEALANTYDRYSHIVYSLFLRITRDESTAEDLVQELFMRVWNRAKEYDEGRGTLGVWITSIARNMAIDHVRSAQARFASRLRPIEHAEWAHAEGAKGPESLIDDTRAVRTALSHLNENQKRVLELAYFEGCSQSEIASLMHEPLGTVKSWMRSALIRIRLSIKGGEV